MYILSKALGILRHLNRGFALALGVVVVMGAAQTARAQMGPDYWKVNGVPANDHLNIRSGPGTKNRIVAHAPNGAVFRNLGCRGEGGGRWCHLETPDGKMSGWASGRFLVESGAPGSHSVSGQAGVPELHMRRSGEMEVRFAAGCSALYNPAGRRVSAGSSCSRAQLSAAHDAVERYMREQGGTLAGSGGADIDMSGSGAIIGGGMTKGRVFGHSEGHYAIVVTSTDDGLTCTGALQHAPGSVRSEATNIHCNGGVNGFGSLVRSKSGSKYTFTFNLTNGTGGYVIY